MAEVGRRRWRIAVVVHGGGFDLGIGGFVEFWNKRAIARKSSFPLIPMYTIYDYMLL